MLIFFKMAPCGIFFLLALLYSVAQSQLCGCGPGSPSPNVIQPQVLAPQVVTPQQYAPPCLSSPQYLPSQQIISSPQLIPTPQIIPSPQLIQAPQLISQYSSAPLLNPPPVVATTVIDNSVSSALANALQLLIVSDLIENALNPAFAPLMNNLGCDIPQLEISPIEILSPISPCGCNPVVEVPNVLLTESLSPLNLAGLQNFPLFNALTPSLCADIPNLVNPNIFGGLTEVVSPCAPNVVGLTELAPIGAIQPNCYCGVQEIPVPIAQVAPVAAEVMFPSSIPAQLTCNFGYMQNSVPCVSVNVEPLPFDNCGCTCGFQNYGSPYYF